MSNAANASAVQSGGILAALRLTKNVRNADKDDLSAAAELFGEWSKNCGWLLVFGLALEVGLAWLNFASGSPCGRWGSVAATFVVLAGVYGEIQFSHWGTACQAELTRRSNDELTAAQEEIGTLGFDLFSTANELSNAQKQILYLRTPRRGVLEGKEDEFVDRIKPFAGTMFDFGHSPEGFREVWDFCWDIEPLFIKAGWVFLDWQNPTGIVSLKQNNWWPTPRAYGMVNVLNVSIELHPSHKAALYPAAKALAGVLNEMGITAYVESSQIVTRDLNPHALHILVGEKT